MLHYRWNVFLRPTFIKRHFATTIPYRTASQFRIPVIDFSKFRTSSSPQEKKETAKEIVSAFKESGFVYLSNHGIDPRKTLSCQILTQLLKPKFDQFKFKAPLKKYENLLS